MRSADGICDPAQLQQADSSRRRFLYMASWSAIAFATGDAVALTPLGPKRLDLEDKIQYSDYIVFAKADEIQFQRLDRSLGRYVRSSADEAEIVVATLSDVNLLVARPGFKNIPWRVMLPQSPKIPENDLIKEFYGRGLVYFIRETHARLPSSNETFNDVIWHDMDIQSQTALPEVEGELDKVIKTIALLKRQGRLFRVPFGR